MGKRLVCLCLVTLLIASPAFAEWFAIGSSVNNSTWYMDPNRVKSVSGKVQAWIKIDSRKDRTVQYSEAMQLLSFDCSAQTYRTISVSKYDSYGKIISTSSVPDYGYSVGYEPVVPDSMAETAEKLACRSASANPNS
jgi:hypothetical protein